MTNLPINQHLLTSIYMMPNYRIDKAEICLRICESSDFGILATKQCGVHTPVQSSAKRLKEIGKNGSGELHSTVGNGSGRWWWKAVVESRQWKEAMESGNGKRQ